MKIGLAVKRLGTFEGSLSTTVETRGKACLIGREETDIVVPDEECSRRHAVLYFRNSTLHIKDLGSLNGTYVNNSQILDIPVRSGDRIRIGTTLLIVEEIDPDCGEGSTYLPVA